MPEVGTTDKDETDTDDDAQPGDANINNEGNGNNNGKPGNGHGNGNNGNNGNGNKPTTTPDPVEPEPVDPDPDVPETPDTPEPGNNGNGNGNNGNDGNGNSAGNNGQGNGNNASNGDGNGSINKTSTVVKNFVVDYNTETFEPLMEHEVNGLDYKYVYGNDRLSVDISPINNSMSIVENGDHIRLYYHMDYLGTADYLTSPVSGKVEAWTHYNEWGLIVHNAVLKCGQRELDLVKRYATHDFDSVLEMYYAKARFYDAHDRRFTAVDPILDPSGYDLREYVKNPVQFVQYLYVVDDPLILIDQDGKKYTLAQGTIAHKTIQAYILSLYPNAIIDKYVYGLKRTKSGKGRPDVVINVANTYHVYEIKSEQYLKNKKYKTSAYNQLSSYITALKNKPNDNFKTFPYATTAQPGTVLQWEDPHIVLPYLPDKNLVLEVWTDHNNNGMIYYEIRNRRKNDDVKSEDFIPQEVRASIGYYANLACEYPDSAKSDYNLVNIDSYWDQTFNDYILDWLDDTQTETVYDVNGLPIIKLTFPDGKELYRPVSKFEFAYHVTDYTPAYSNKHLLNIYNGEISGWYDTISFTPGDTFIPIVPIPMPMPTPMPSPVPIKLFPSFA